MFDRRVCLYGKEVNRQGPYVWYLLRSSNVGFSLGGKTYKLKFGHHGCNHPVKDLIDGKISITSQNHGFCIDIDSLNKDEVELMHINLNDNTPEGIKHKKYDLFSVQFHPEAAPGPHEASYLFENFIGMMDKKKVSA